MHKFLIIALLIPFSFFGTGCSTVANSVPNSSQTDLNNAKLTFTTAAALYDGICATSAAPAPCSDPKAIAAETAIKISAASAFDAAQTAINGGGNLSQDQIDQLVSDAIAIAAQISAMSGALK